MKQKQINWTELTWKDIVELEGIINNVHYDFSAGIGQESFGKEVLERFRSTKGIEYLDEAEQKCYLENKAKDLLFKDLCTRLPFNVVLRCTDSDTDYKCFLTTDILREIQNNYQYYEYKPYLRPMSSMTEEERNILDVIFFDGSFRDGAAMDFLRENHFDCRGLIEKGLAIAVTDENNPYK